ncbi:hypothetical protein AgCh_027715 [Apium graveolens]
MSLAVEVGSSTCTSKNMGFDEKINEGAKENEVEIKKDEAESEIKNGDSGEEKLTRQMSRSSVDGSDHDDDEEDEDGVDDKLQLGPQCSLKEQFEKDKDDESLRRWKEQLLGSVDIESVGETLDPEVKILSLAIKSTGRSDIVLPIPESGNPKGPWFTLKEGSVYSLKFKFKVFNNIVSGLKYHNTVWKTGLKGTFSFSCIRFMPKMILFEFS